MFDAEVEHEGGETAREVKSSNERVGKKKKRVLGWENPQLGEKDHRG